MFKHLYCCLQFFLVGGSTGSSFIILLLLLFLFTFSWSSSNFFGLKELLKIFCLSGFRAVLVLQKGQSLSLHGFVQALNPSLIILISVCAMCGFPGLNSSLILVIICVYVFFLLQVLCTRTCPCQFSLSSSCSYFS